MKKIIFLIIFLFFFNNTYAINHGDFFASNLTIKELWQNIEKLKDEKLQLKIKTKELSKEYWELISFIKTDLEQKDLYEIKNEIEKYIEKRDFLELKLKNTIWIFSNTTQIKKDIILQKAEFYKFLSKYVEKTKRNDFIEYIKFNIQITKETKDLIEELTINQNIFDKKIIIIKDKIEIHKEDLQERIENILISTITKRIKEIDEDEKYKSISLKEKNNIYNEFITKINQRLDNIEKSNLSENYKEIRKNILNKMIEEINRKIIKLK